MRCRLERTMYLTPIITMETPPKDTSDLGVSRGGGLVSPLQQRLLPTDWHVSGDAQNQVRCSHKGGRKVFPQEGLRTLEKDRGRRVMKGRWPPKSLPDAEIPPATSQQVSRSYLRSPVTLPPPGYLGLGLKQDYLIASLNHFHFWGKQESTALL